MSFRKKKKVFWGCFMGRIPAFFCRDCRDYNGPLRIFTYVYKYIYIHIYTYVYWCGILSNQPVEWDGIRWDRVFGFLLWIKSDSMFQLGFNDPEERNDPQNRLFGYPQNAQWILIKKYRKLKNAVSIGVMILSQENMIEYVFCWSNLFVWNVWHRCWRFCGCLAGHLEEGRTDLP